MATIGKTKTGKWCAQVRTHQKYISKTFISKAHASKWAKEVEYQLDREQFEDFSDSAKLSLGDILIRYRDEITPTKKSKDTETYKINLMLRHKISKIRLLDLKTKHVLDFKKDIKDNDGKFYPRASSTINKYVHFIYTVWETAKVNWGITLPPLNPVSLVKAEKVKDKIDRILTPEEYQDLLSACSKSNLVFLQDMVEFAYLTAMRFGEITKLKFKNVNFEKSTALLLDTKNGNNRLVPLTDRALEIAKKYRFQPRLFPVTRDKCRHYFEQAMKRAQIHKFRFHDLRACAITNLFLNGWSIAEVSVVSGHKTWSELQRYTRIKASDLIVKINKKGIV
jgi:integrase